MTRGSLSGGGPEVRRSDRSQTGDSDEPRAQRGIAGWWNGSPAVYVTGAAEAAAADRHAIDVQGIPSRALMQRAGAAVAARVLALAPSLLSRGVVVFCGGGNNGGDGWVIARSLAAAGVRVRVDEVVGAKSPDCRAERQLALPFVSSSAEDEGEAIAVDAILGTGAQGAPHGSVLEGLRRLTRHASRGALVVAVDVPSGLDATSGAMEGGVVTADETVALGTVKRGLLLARGVAGRIVLVDIGISGVTGNMSGAPRLADAALVRLVAPPLPPSAHKGIRRKLAIIGGAEGMAGAAGLATHASMLSGIGMTRAVVDRASVAALQGKLPAAMCASWPADDSAVERDISSWADGVVIGPGLGRTAASRDLVERVLRCWRGPVVLDADALSIFEGEAESLAQLLAGRPSAVTPHVTEFARLSGSAPDEILADPFEAARSLASRLGAVVLLKGVPTVIASPHGRLLVSARGTAALAAAGSGDLLAGIAGTLLTQNPDASLEALAAAAWAHGRAGELVSDNGTRGVMLESVMSALPGVWNEPVMPPSPLALMELPDPSGTQLLTYGGAR